MSKVGIDVSKHQGTVDWTSVKKSGIDFAIIRAGYGQNNIDNQFYSNINGCIENNIEIGVYWFIYGINKQEIIKNAEMCHSVISQYKEHIKMKVWCDFEYDTEKNANNRGFTYDKDTRTQTIIEFCEKMKDYGYDVGYYANTDYLKTKLGDLSKFPLWLAGYSISEEQAKQYNPCIWQNSSSGKVNGIKGNVDTDLFFENEESEENSMVPVYCYSKAKNGTEKLSENFKVSEFACKDGSDVILIAPELVTILQAIRSHFGKAVVINSAYRTPTYNTKVGGATYSQHQYGTAADITVSGITPKQVAEFAEKLLYNRGGIGIYSGFTHIDVREVKSRWNG